MLKRQWNTRDMKGAERMHGKVNTQEVVWETGKP